MTPIDVHSRMIAVLAEQVPTAAEGAAVLMVSGGSDSTALAYLASDLQTEGRLGVLAMLHVNHCLRGKASDEDERFVTQLAQLLNIPLITRRIDISSRVDLTGENWEAAARHERYAAAHESLRELCNQVGVGPDGGFILTAHTADDRIENFFMRSIVGTGPGGFRSMKYRNGAVCRPLLDCERKELREAIRERAVSGLPIARDDLGNLWREDATNDETDRFRAFVRHEMVPVARRWNPALTSVLTRTMNLIGDEDDLLDSMATTLIQESTCWLDERRNPDGHAALSFKRPGEDYPSVICEIPIVTSVSQGMEGTAGFILLPAFGVAPVPLQRRAIHKLLKAMLGQETRIDTATVQGILSAFDQGSPLGGYVTNVQGNLAVSANKRGVRVEPMEAFRARRKKTSRSTKELSS